MNENSAPKRVGLFIIFLLFGLATWIFPLMLTDLIKLAYQLCLPILFLLAALWLKRSENLSIYYPVVYAFFIAAVATALAAPFGGGTTVDNRTYNLLISSILVVGSILILTKLSGGDFKSVFLQKGNLRSGLILGWIIFFFFLVTALPASQLFGANPVTTEQLIEWTPWMAVFIFVNGLREELWFRGIFLRKYTSFLGNDPSNFLQAMIFGAAHLVFPISILNLTGNLMLFFLTFLIGFLCGAAMLKTDSILASILIHAGADIPFLIAAFSFI
ncbi:MAG: CPBP family intramembrane glutamic endopeptidase [Candidatus Thorarchaeota archaeon]